jgi:hypothetical protein
MAGCFELPVIPLLRFPVVLVLVVLFAVPVFFTHLHFHSKRQKSLYFIALASYQHNLLEDP